DPCEVLQSPIPLEKNLKQMFRAQALLKAPKDAIEQYAFNEDKKQWDVLNNVFLTNNQQQYTLSQFHFHAPSEHSIDGAFFALEAHFVFEAQPQNVSPGTEEGFGNVLGWGLL